MTTTDLETSLSKMQIYLETPAGHEPQDLLDRIEYLNILVAKSGQLLAKAKYIQDDIINTGLLQAMEQELDKKLSPSLVNKFVNSGAKNINYLVSWADRINAAATHQLDGIRTIISYKKAELNL
jgi:hypothetical protein